MSKKSINCTLLACIMVLLLSCDSSHKQAVDITDFKCKISADSSNSPVGEEITNLVDNDIYSKFLTFNSSAVVKITNIKKSFLQSYTIVSGGDEALRDPSQWTLEGSNDMQSWTIIDKQDSVKFTDRNQAISYTVTKSDAYKYYKFNLKTANSDILQLSEIEMQASWDSNDSSPLAVFTSENKSFFDKGEVHFKNTSLEAKSYKWIFKGGTPETSTDENPTVTYSKRGKYEVQLIAINNALSDTTILKDFVQVKQLGAWDDFQYPNINFDNTTIKTTGKLYDKLVPNPVDLINSVCIDVCKILYRSTDEINVLTILDYTIEDIETLSAKGGNPPHINIFFSSSYLNKLSKTETNEQMLSEIKGVLYHELTHGYQYSPKGAGAYTRGSDYFGFIEGIADYVRQKAGYTDMNFRKVGGHWNDGYKTTGFFIDWLCTKDIDFAYKFNQTANTIIPWSWDKACQEILSTSTQALWNEYQEYIKNNTNS